MTRPIRTQLQVCDIHVDRRPEDPECIMEVEEGRQHSGGLIRIMTAQQAHASDKKRSRLDTITAALGIHERRRGRPRSLDATTSSARRGGRSWTPLPGQSKAARTGRSRTQAEPCSPWRSCSTKNFLTAQPLFVHQGHTRLPAVWKSEPIMPKCATSLPLDVISRRVKRRADVTEKAANDVPSARKFGLGENPGSDARWMSAPENFQTPLPQTVGAYVAKYMEDLLVLRSLGQRSQGTLNNYVSIAKLSFGVQRFGTQWLVDVRCSLLSRPIVDLTVADVRAWHRQVAQDAKARGYRTVKTGTRVANHALVLLALAFQLAEEDRLVPIGSSPTRHVARFKQSSADRFLFEDELAAIWSAIDKVEKLRIRAACKVHRKYAGNITQALRLILLLGLRKNEALRLRWSEVFNLSRGPDHAVLRLKTTKTGYREVSISEPAIAVLQRQLKVRENDWVFSARQKRGSPVQQVYPVWQQILEVAGVDSDQVVVHTARHSLATNSLRNGGLIEDVSLLLGHASVKVTQEVYARPLATPGTRSVVAKHAAMIVRAA